MKATKGPLGEIEPKLLAPASSIAGGGYTLADYWQWADSALLDNASRGVFAEFLVLTAVAGEPRTPRPAWDYVDLRVELDGRQVEVEVKSSAYVQSWGQTEVSKPVFDIRPTYRIHEDNTKSSEKRRWSDVYVFCLLAAKEITSHREVLDVQNWRFYVVSTAQLDRERPNQQSVALGSLMSLEPIECPYEDLRAAILSVIEKRDRTPTSRESGG
ncbi:MAG: hypothetical protein OXG44_11750 [Gammaproteobacteria bacterium]|nr:hypothetical protein [Gammaproteobacteria bacterium]